MLFAAKSVIFYDMLPETKLKVVNLLRTHLKFRPVVMSIGNSFSDVPMIRASDIGIMMPAIP